jgi:DUF1680 family protein
MNLTVRTSAKVAFDLKFRVPRWSKGVIVKINGEQQNVACEPGTWALIHRTWASGDRVTLQLPMQIAFAPIDEQHPHRVAVTYGPVVLVRNQDPILVPKGSDASQWIVAKGQPLEFSGLTQPHGSFLPFYKVGMGTPYNMYFDLES